MVCVWPPLPAASDAGRDRLEKSPLYAASSSGLTTEAIGQWFWRLEFWYSQRVSQLRLRALLLIDGMAYFVANWAPLEEAEFIWRSGAAVEFVLGSIMAGGHGLDNKATQSQES